MGPLLNWLLTVFSPRFSLIVNLIGAVVLVARVILKLTPSVKLGVSSPIYVRFRTALAHLALSLGQLESQI